MFLALYQLALTLVYHTCASYARVFEHFSDVFALYHIFACKAVTPLRRYSCASASASASASACVSARRFGEWLSQPFATLIIARIFCFCKSFCAFCAKKHHNRGKMQAF